MKWTFWIVAALCFAGSASAAQDPVKWSLTTVARPAVLRPGSTLGVRLTGQIAEGWYIYSITQSPGGPVPSRVTLPAEQTFTLAGTIVASEHELRHDGNFGIEVEYHMREVTFTLPVQVAATAQNGSNDLQVHVRYQACNSEVCLPPRTERLTLPLPIRK